MNAIQIKDRLASGGNFTPEQAEDLAEELAGLAESQLVTDTQLDAKLNQLAVKVLLGVFAMNSLFLAAASFLLQ